MALEDYLEPEIAVTAAVTAAVFSPRARKVIRRGAVYGLAGILAASDAITSFSRNVKQGIQEASTAAVEATRRTVEEAKAGATEAAERLHAAHSTAGQSDGETPAPA
jgi:Pyruvate/2-oxoacid:ferredoxin oxidoreductase gamma subunit